MPILLNASDSSHSSVISLSSTRTWGSIGRPNGSPQAQSASQHDTTLGRCIDAFYLSIHANNGGFADFCRINFTYRGEGGGDFMRSQIRGGKLCCRKFLRKPLDFVCCISGTRLEMLWCVGLCRLGRAYPQVPFSRRPLDCVWEILQQIGNWKLEIGNWKLETGNWKLQIGNAKFPTQS